MRFERLIPHATIILSGMCLVLFVLDRFNQYMHFLLNDITKWLVAILSVFAIVTSILCIGGYIRADEQASKDLYEKEMQTRKSAKLIEKKPIEKI